MSMTGGAGGIDGTGAGSLALIACASLVSVLGGAPAAGAQTWVGDNIEGGMHWHVAAPEGANWRLECRFPPVTYYRSAYEQKAWINRFERRGRGADSGRLPLNSGYCHVWKTGGRGSVGIGLSRPGETVADATRDPAHPAAVGFL
ncbi:MAG TPA: hypothetical protein VD906_01960 [Caulobacteraceae bacterium]|nr:hypothetical protein [Caulobacteraceae bacterium]